MTRGILSLPVADLSAFARNLSRQLADAVPPSHQALMNMLARAGGFQNLQHLRAAQSAAARLAAPPAPPEVVDHRLVERALAEFDAAGRLRRWPSRRRMQALCLWAIWARLPAGQYMTERRVSTAISALHLFGDAAMIRRDMVGLGLMTRNPGGADYCRVEQPPPPEERVLVRHLAGRRAE